MRKVVPTYRDGFALISTLAVSVLLLGMALMAAACMALDHGCSTRGLARARAKLAAEAALRIALGELQSSVGPDRRATGEAGLLSPDGPHPHWTAVWRSDRLNAEPPGVAPFVSRDGKGALRDRRFGEGAPYSAAREVLRWLVSCGDADPVNLRKRLREEDCLVVQGVHEPGPPVLAPAQDAGNGVRFAWWAGDEGCKARSNLSQPSLRDKSESPCRLAPPACTGAGFVLAGVRPSPGRNLFGTDGDAELLWGSEILRGRLHDFTPCSAGVLADQREGGLRRDLTAFLLSDGTVTSSDGSCVAADSLPLFSDVQSPFRRFGPRFGLFRNWAALGEAASTGVISPVTGRRRQVLKTPAPADVFHDGTHADLPDTADWSEAVVAPVLTEAAVYLRPGVDGARRRPDGGPWMRLHLHPRVALWNPYDAALAPARYLVHLRVGGSPEFRLVKSGKRLTGKLTGWRVYRDDEVNYATTQGSLLFILDCPRLEPGRSLLFSPGRTARWDLKNPGANRLEPSGASAAAHFFLEDSDAFEAAGLKDLAGVNLDGESWRLENSAAEDHAAALKLVPSGAAVADWYAPRQYPTLRYISCSHKCGVGTTADPAWPAGAAEPLLDSMQAGPAPMTRDGVRLRWLEETAGNRSAFAPSGHMQVAPLGDFNPVAPYSARHPFDNSTPAEPGGRAVRRPEYFGLFTRDAFDPSVEWTALSPGGAPSSVPLGSPATFPRLNEIVAAPLPPAGARFTALADLGFVPLSPWAWQPLRAVGESRCSPAAPSDSTAHGAVEEDWAGMGVGAKHYLDWVRRAESPGEPLVYDARFEANHALFDGWCLLSGDSPRRTAFIASNGREALPHARLFPVPGVPDGIERLTGRDACRRAASAVMISGAFNINSVSVDAWRAVLSSGLGYGGDGTEVGGLLTPFPRSPRAPVSCVGGGGDFRESEHWRNSRALTPDEIGRLACEMVTEVRRRGPFLSLSDFVNRRLEGGRVSCDPSDVTPNACGALQAAIDRSGVNRAESGCVIPRMSALPGTRHEPEHKAWVNVEGAASRLSQGDVLRALGPVMAARSDTFRVRAVAEVPCAEGGVARVVLEAFVQRVPAPVVAGSGAPDEPSRETAGIWGRRLRVSRVCEVR